MGAVIRRESGSSASAFSFQDVEREARTILTRARAQANQLLLAAEAQAQQLADARRAEAVQQGLAEGRQLGMEQIRQAARQAAVQAARAELERLKGALQAALTEYEARRHGLIAQAESGLIVLAAAIARRVCKLCVEASTEATRANVRALLEMVRHCDDVEIHLNPAEHELLAEILPDLVRGVAGLEHVTLKPDAAVARGGCILHTAAGSIDASIEGQVERIAAALGVSLAAEHPVQDAPAGSPWRDEASS